MPALTDGAVGAVLVAPEVGAHRCANCKFQGQLPEFPQQKLCLRSPPGVTSIFIVDEIGGASRPAGAGSETQYGARVIGHIQKDVSYPPAIDHWTCGEWKPRLAV